MYFKLKAWEMIGAYPSLHSDAKITINYDDDINAAVFEQKLIYYKRKVAYINAFEVKICGFDYFIHGNSYTIFAKAAMSNFVENMLMKFNKTFSKNRIKTPHITIVRNISKEKFEILWPYFNNLAFECSFYADKICVLETPSRKFYNQPMRVKTQINLNNFNKN